MLCWSFTALLPLLWLAQLRSRNSTVLMFCLFCHSVQHGVFENSKYNIWDQLLKTKHSFISILFLYSSTLNYRPRPWIFFFFFFNSSNSFSNFVRPEVSLIVFCGRCLSHLSGIFVLGCQQTEKKWWKSPKMCQSNQGQRKTEIITESIDFVTVTHSLCEEARRGCVSTCISSL